jgi:hypothetical protein
MQHEICFAFCHPEGRRKLEKLSRAALTRALNPRESAFFVCDVNAVVMLKNFMLLHEKISRESFSLSLSSTLFRVFSVRRATFSFIRTRDVNG